MIKTLMIFGIQEKIKFLHIPLAVAANIPHVTGLVQSHICMCSIKSLTLLFKNHCMLEIVCKNRHSTF